jgi:2-isopropylmalate synthase
VEACLFGNGERTGNVDMITVAMNMYVQGVDPELDFSHMDRIRAMYERCTKMRVPERQPYAGDLVFTAFSGSHQDAINKGFNYMEKAGTGLWEVPYLPIDPTDLGRAYEPVRINSQSGKGGAAFIMNHKFGFDMPKAMHPEFGDIVQAESDRTGKELKSDVIFELFKTHYLDINGPYRLVKHSFHEETVGGESQVTFTGTIEIDDTRFVVVGEGNGPIDAFFNAIHGQKMDKYTFIDYKEHAISNGSDSMAVAYVQLRRQDGSDIFGVGMSHNINLAPLRAILCAINRDKQMKRNQEG